MNVLILTPDAVGSTLLQRLITIYMQFHEFDRPVINLHELTNGLERYYSPDFGREIVSKKRVENWGYYQSLQAIVELLAGVDHYKVSRLAQYHIRQRQDPLSHQIPFYQYLDQNFFVIACRRHNVFEHALSMTLNSITKKLNVYHWAEKRDTFLDIYKKKIDLDVAAMGQVLESYKSYLDWSANHFNVSSYFYYDEHLDHIERWILDLPIFQQQVAQITWAEKFGLDLATWNRCHNLTADLGAVALENSRSQELLLSNDVGVREQPGSDAAHEILDDSISSSHAIVNHLPGARQQYLLRHRNGYHTAVTAIEHMQKLDIIPSPPPIKKQTLEEKRFVIRNFDQCLDNYNDWAIKNPSISSVLTADDIDDMIARENLFWTATSNRDVAAGPAQNAQLLVYQSDDRL